MYVCIFAALTASALFVGCKQNVNNGTETLTVKKFMVSFSVEGENGTIAAKVDGKVIGTGAKIEKDKTIIFTATPAPNYAVDGWTLNGATVSGNATNTYSHTITANADIKVRFKSSQTPPPAVEKYAVTFSAGANGSLTAKVDGNTISSGAEVEKDKTVTFTAIPAANYKVKAWTVDGVVDTSNTSSSYTHTITKAVSVKVEFEALPAGQASYTVKHYQEQTDGTYPAEPAETESLNGTAGATAAYNQKEYKGFTYKQSLTKINGTVQITGTIDADGSTVIELYYKRNTVKVTFKFAGGNVSGNTNDIVKNGKYGTNLDVPVPVKAHAVLTGWDPALTDPVRFPDADTEYTAQWQDTFTVNFGVEGSPANGSLTAKVDDNTIDNGAKVEKDKTITFTAAPDSGYAVAMWHIEGGVVESGTGTPENGTAKVTVTANTTVRVSFTLTSDLQTLLNPIMKNIPSETDADIPLESSIPGYEITWTSSDANILKVESSGVGRITYDLIDRTVALSAEIEDKATHAKAIKTKIVTVKARKKFQSDHDGYNGRKFYEFEGDKLTITDTNGRPVIVYRVQIDDPAKTIRTEPEQAAYDSVLMTPEEAKKKLIAFMEKTSITPICSLLLLLEKTSVTLKDLLQASHGMGGGPKTEEDAFTLIARSNPGLSYEAFLQKSEEEQTTLIKSVLENSKKEVYEICFINPETMPLAQALPKIREFARAQIQSFYSERLKAPVTYTYRIEKDTLSTHAVYVPNISWYLQVGRYEYTDSSSASVKKVSLYKEDMLTMGSRISIDIDDWCFGLRYKDSPSFPAKANGLREHNGKEITVNEVNDRGDGTVDVDISGDIRFSGNLTFRGDSIRSIGFNFEG